MVLFTGFKGFNNVPSRFHFRGEQNKPCLPTLVSPITIRGREDALNNSVAFLSNRTSKNPGSDVGRLMPPVEFAG